MSGETVLDRFADPVTVKAPYDYYGALRDEAPVFFSPSVGGFVVTRFDEARTVLSNDKIFSSEPRVQKIGAMAKFAQAYVPLYEAAGTPPPLPTLVVVDGDLHTRHRQLVDSWFNAPAVRKLDASIIEIVEKLIDDFLDNGRADIYQDFCLKLPLIVVCDMLGLPRDNAVLMHRSGDAQVKLASGGVETEESRVACHQVIIEFQKFIQTHIDRARANPSDQLLDHLVNTTTKDGDKLSDREIHSLVQTLNAGGTETTTNGLGNMFGLMLENPTMQAELRADPALIPRFAEETLRLESPVAGGPRWAKHDTEIGGVAIPADSLVLARIGAANRDERRYGCPADIDMNRGGLRNHVGFGAGLHYCLGAVLARFEMKVSMERVLARMGNVRFDPDAPAPERSTKMGVRAWQNLPIVFDKIG